MWVLLSTISYFIIGITGRATNGVIVVHPEEITLPEEIVYSDETDLPNSINLHYDADISSETENPDLSEIIIIPDSLEVDDDGFSENPTVVIAQGRVVGSYSEDDTYAQFYGIPYADTTSGSNRFKAPNLPPAFQETFIANRRDIKCVRALGNGYEGTEDCLVANVFTTSYNSSRRLPVMVWVKGREFEKVYEYEPSFKNFMDQDIVVVTLNYRESILGFLCLGTETAPGNAGLKDIIAGLRWVQENIAEFGGNPNDITLVGHGSGAAAVDLVTLSPMANGLVHKAIVQSGNALSPWAVARDNVHYALEVAEALGHIVNDAEELSQVFQRTSIAALMGVINELELTDNSLAFAPCLERENLEGVVPFMVKSPFQSLLEGDFLQIPFITGFVDNEGTIRSEEAIEDNWLDKMDDSFIEFIQPDLKFESNELKSQVAQNVRSFYFRDDPIDMEHIDNYINYHGDTMIVVSALRETRLRATKGTAPVYLYQFSYKGSLGEPFVGLLEVDSAAHSEELAYLFYDSNDNEIPQRDRSIGDMLVERWSWFTKTGQPLSATSPVFWPAFTTVASNYLRILDNDEINEQSALDIVLTNPHPEAVTYWDQIYEEHFLDAEDNWDWSGRDEDDEDEDGSGDGEDDSGDVNGGEDGSGDVDGDEDGSGDDNIDGDGGDDGSNPDPEDENTEVENNSASSVVAHSFSIIALLTILNKIHQSQILL